MPRLRSWTTAALTGAFARLVRRYLPWSILDAFVVALSLVLGFLARSINADLSVSHAIGFGIVAIGVYTVVGYLFHLHARVWRYASAAEVVVIGADVAASSAILLAADLAWQGERPVPIGVLVLVGMF